MLLFFEVVIIVLLILFANSSVDVAGFMLNLFWFLLCVMYVCLFWKLLKSIEAKAITDLLPGGFSQ